MWPFRTAEDRALSWTDQISDARQSAAEGASLSADGLAALEIVAGLYARAFSQANITGTALDIPPDTLAVIGRSFATKGQCVLALDEGEPVPAASWDVSGKSLDPLAWTVQGRACSAFGQRKPHVAGQ